MVPSSSIEDVLLGSGIFLPVSVWFLPGGKTEQFFASFQPFNPAQKVVVWSRELFYRLLGSWRRRGCLEECSGWKRIDSVDLLTIPALPR